MSINRVVITGNLTRDPELRRTQSGMAILAIGVAVNDRRRNPANGEWEDYANYIDCTMFGARAESLSNILTKGMKVGIEGKLRWSQWERDGQKRSKIEVIVDDLEFMSSRGGQGGQGGQQGGGYSGASSQSYQPAPSPSPAVGSMPSTGTASAPAPAPAIDVASSVYDDDIPF